ncbi:unnamed protein product [Ceutorhynchus assimilis]|uniref:Small RNA 2'-O-methyltransferase n=1 Tax=Ceutorhynchus assimilis TaxID=467358 RepID=A0A9P0DNT2_9CUCU|nr:unnamed protein product [Ceutorhynchus assimilis]
MLITFHYFALLVYELLKNRKRLKKIIENPVADHETQLKFHPPVFKQRLSKVYQTLIEEKWRNDLKKLVDFGCAEFDLFMYLKNLNIEEIMFVDIDETSLKENLGKLEPFLVDRLRRRSHPLEILVFRGSAVDPDYRLCKTDVVTAIELIEHLYPDTLEALPYNIFSFVKPKLVIITTPNADFNVVFGRPGLRHPDHKFEWTRQQFEDWATNITQQFTDYSVEFTGIGKLLNQPENIGHCSQGAIFIRKDLLNEKYISPIYARKCQCDNSSPCKGQTTECKLLCNCVCALCLPDFSVGICKYFSCNVEEFEAYRPMKTWPKLETPSDTEPKLELFSNVDNYCNDTLINPLYNIFYKLIMKIDYPYELDTRSETERLMETFKYRINNFTSFNNRFYNEKTGQCEIPLIDIMYGDICISNEEISNLLCEAGYKLEKCITPQTGEPELCIISIPHEMDDIENTSEETEEYPNNSLSDETSNIDHNIDPGNLSDWDETPHVSATASTIQPKPNPDPLFDSGYLNSPSPVDAVAQEETDDQFEEATSSFSVGDKKNAVPRPLPIIMTTTNYRKHDPHKNELDRYHNMAIEHRTHNFEEYHEAVPGPSCSLPKPKKLKPKFEMKLFKEPTIVDDAKSLANIIVQNSLNIIDEDDLEIVAQSPLEIMDFLQEEEPQEVLVPVVEAMENGDLANNNRDNEGNNLEHNQLEMEVDEGIDLLNDNLEEIIAPNNVNLQENNNDLQVEAPAEEFLPVEIVENEAAPLNDLEVNTLRKTTIVIRLFILE